MKTITEERRLKVKTCYLNALKMPTEVHFTFDWLDAAEECFTNHSLVTNFESLFCEPLLNAFKAGYSVGIEATFTPDCHKQRTEITDVTGVEPL